VTSLANVRYLTGFSGSSALLLVTERDVVLVTDFRYQTQVADEVGELARVSIETQSLWTGLWRQRPQLTGVEVLGFESAHLLHRDFQRLLEAGGSWQWRPTLDVVEGLRERKDADELALIAEAADVATAALARLLPQVRAGMTELQIAGLLEVALRDAGSEGFPFPTIVASGPRAALPHARSSTREIARGDFLLLDFGAVVGGYCADITRTVVVGEASERQREVFGVVREANAQAAAAVRPGMRGRDADAVARRLIAERGYGEAFGHSLGHGIGLEVHEPPWLSQTRGDEPLRSGMVFSVEPGIYLPGWGGVRIEDLVVLEPDGARVLCHAPKQLVQDPPTRPSSHGGGSSK
jgi:Xaa-Pro aminopeptidase